MKHIQKKISLEQFKSRMPSTIGAYDNNGEYHFIDCVSYPYSNYGMIPKNIIWHFGNIYNGKSLSYNTVASWFHFCENYFKGLTINEKCPISYPSYLAYYESYDKCPYSLEYCEELDDIFSNVIGGHEAYGYMCDVLFPRYILNEELADEWKTDKLYINDILKWIAWFDERNNKYANISDCSSVDDCCDCEKYHSLGGEKMYDSLVGFIDTLKDGLTESFDDAYAIIPLYISNSIDNMGEFSILSEEWEGGVNYGKDNIISYNGDSYITLNNNSYEFNDIYKEFSFNESGFTPYKKEFVTSSITDTYAYKENGELVINPNNENMADEYPLFSKKDGYFVIKDNVFEVLTLNYIAYNNTYYQIYYDTVNNPYCIIDNRKHFGVYDENTDTFTIENQTIVSDGKFIKYDNRLVLVENDKVKINKVFYPKVDAYAKIDNKIVIFKDNVAQQYEYSDSGNTELILSKKILDKEYHADGLTVKIYRPYTTYSASTITAYTESKLSSLFSDNISMYDRLGNKLPGVLLKNDDGTYTEPSENGWLDIYYQPKNMSHISREEDGTCWGNIIESLKFYYEGSDGKEIYSTINSIEFPKLSSISAITDCIKTLKEIIDEEGDYFTTKYGVVSDLKCDIQYHMGARFTINGSSVTINDSGITYIDTVTLQPKQCYYYMNETYCYGLNYYELIWDTIEYRNDDYNVTQSTPKSKIIYSSSIMNEENGFTNFPLIREEYKFGTSSLENVKADIYIDRGTARAIDTHLKLMEVHSMEALENYGNSSINIIKN